MFKRKVELTWELGGLLARSPHTHASTLFWSSPEPRASSMRFKMISLRMPRARQKRRLPRVLAVERSPR